MPLSSSSSASSSSTYFFKSMRADKNGALEWIAYRSRFRISTITNTRCLAPSQQTPHSKPFVVRPSVVVHTILALVVLVVVVVVLVFGSDSSRSFTIKWPTFSTLSFPSSPPTGIWRSIPVCSQLYPWHPLDWRAFSLTHSLTNHTYRQGMDSLQFINCGYNIESSEIRKGMNKRSTSGSLFFLCLATILPAIITSSCFRLPFYCYIDAINVARYCSPRWLLARDSDVASFTANSIVSCPCYHHVSMSYRFE